MNFENEEQLIESVKRLSDKVSIIHYHKKLQPKKTMVKKYGEIGEIEKRSIFQVRAGVNYEDVVVIEEKEEETDSDKPKKQPTMEKIGDGVYRNRFSQKLFIGSQPVNNDDFKAESNYYVNGKQTDLDEFIEDKTFADFLYAADLPKDGDNDREFQYLGVENIEKIEEKP